MSQVNTYDASNRPSLWADRNPEKSSETILTTSSFWCEDDPELNGEDQGCQLHRVSAAKEMLLKEAFSKLEQNGMRCRWRQKYGMPAFENTKCPKLDTTLKAQVPKACKDGDRPLCRLQTLVLDAVGPLAHILESLQKGSLSNETTIEAVKHEAGHAISGQR